MSFTIVISSYRMLLIDNIYSGCIYSYIILINYSTFTVISMQEKWAFLNARTLAIFLCRRRLLNNAIMQFWKILTRIWKLKHFYNWMLIVFTFSSSKILARKGRMACSKYTEKYSTERILRNELEVFSSSLAYITYAK